MALRERLAGWDERLLGRTADRSSATDPGPSLVLSLGVLVFGVAIALAGALGAWRALGPTLFTSSAYALPATFERHLDHGDYEVFERTFTDGPTTIGPNDVVVVGPDGDTLPVEPADGTETLERSSRSYTAAVWFHVPSDGTYRLSIRSEGGYAEALVTLTFGEAFRRAAVWLAIAFLGGLAAVTGIVLLVVGSTRRHRGVGPGWYADPGGSGRLRWWNGVGWTEHMW